ncbi:MAG: PVC-type heme-binding CxxCH protein [Planctomycetota bacterium]
MICNHLSLLAFMACLLLQPVQADEAPTGQADEAPTVQAELSAFRLADPSLSISLVAAEPAVASPVAIAWDEFQRLYVVEMTDYPADGSGGQIKRLEDRDGDGIYEHVSLFAEKLAYPSGVLPYKGGILVTSAPNLLFLKDTDGDGRSDLREVVLTGFGEGNQQLRVNSPTWGLDNWVYLANGRSGGAIRRPADPIAKAVSITRNDIRLRPSTGQFEPITGFSQFGLPRDDWGNRFPSWNTVPIRHAVTEIRGPNTGQVADILNLDDGGRLYSLAPSQKRFNAESVAFFNATCGPVINRDRQLGPAYQGHAFLCEPLSSLVHHRELVPDGPTFHARRVEQGREFLASANPWFRPVNLANGPDGALYLVDFCRAWVEHPAFVPEKLRNSVDFRQGHQKGRIWRIQARSNPEKNTTPPPGKLTTNDLVALLEHPNSWYRDTAQRLIVERQESAAIAPLRLLAKNSRQPLAIIQALWALSGLNALENDSIHQALLSNNQHIREQAVKLSMAELPEFQNQLATLASDPSIRVRLQVAISLSAIDSPIAIRSLGKIASTDADSPYISPIILTKAQKNPLQFLQSILSEKPQWLNQPDPFQANFLEQLASMGSLQKNATQIRSFLDLSISAISQPISLSILSGLYQNGDPFKSSGLVLTKPQETSLNTILQHAQSTVNSTTTQGWIRALAFRLLANSNPEIARLMLTKIIQADQPPDLQIAGTRVLPKFLNQTILNNLYENWDKLSLSSRRTIIATLSTNSDLASTLLFAIEKGRLAPSEIDPSSRQAMRKLSDPDFQKQITRVLNDSPLGNRLNVINNYSPALALKANPADGKTLFEKNCQACHSYRGKGAKVGPELAGVAGKSQMELLISILDPARDATPDGIAVVVLTKDGRTLSGLLAQETPTNIKLKRAEGIEDSIDRSEIESIRSTGRSLMPEGLEQVISTQQMADLISFLRDPAIAP